MTTKRNEQMQRSMQKGRSEREQKEKGDKGKYEKGDIIKSQRGKGNKRKNKINVNKNN